MSENTNVEIITAEWVKSALPRRPLDANKGTFGRVLVAAGSINYVGAAYLACSGALRVGAGLVTLAAPVSLHPVFAARLTEVTYLLIPETSAGILSPQAVENVLKEMSNYNVLLMGSGSGQKPETINFIRSVLFEQKTKLPLTVLDADALNALSGVPEWWRKLTDNVILTPHPGEMARLAGVKVEEVQSDRAGLAKKMAEKWHKTVVLKGANTVIATPDGQVKINNTANPGLATAGTGDVLSGVIAGLLAQGLTLSDAAVCGVYIHAQAGELVKEKMGDTGMIASDLLPVLPLAIKKLKENF